MLEHENEIPMTIRGESNGGSACKLVQLANYADEDGICVNVGVSVSEEGNFFYNDPSQIVSCKVKINCLETGEDESRILAVMETPEIEFNGLNRFYSFSIYKSMTRLCTIEKLSLLEFYVVFKCRRVSISMIDRF